ncbi:MAG: phosphatidate cytidylyltransferase [Gammaproteobacteria bacterium]|nr:phosphatidate cytidylyltransferase [Gammaproteobacteria bacterium]
MSSTLAARVVTAVVLISLVVGLIGWAPPVYLRALCLFFLAIAAWEWARLNASHGAWRYFYAAATVGVALSLIVGVTGPTVRVIILAVASGWWVCAAGVVVMAQRGRDLLPRDRPWIMAMLGWLVLLPAFWAIVWLHETSRILALGGLVLVWGADSAAFFAGRKWGRRRLADRISPGKTWEGVAAGLAAAPVIGSGLAVAQGSGTWRAVIGVALFSIVVVAASIVGDLFESLIKRRGGFKDSSNLLPGHGGVLDRIDALLAASPIYATAIVTMVRW